MSYNASTQVTHDALVVKPEHRYGSKGQAIPQDSEENRGSIGAQSSTSVVDQVRTPPEDAGVTSSSTICPAPVCRQFWKAGSYIDELSSKSQQPSMQCCLYSPIILLSLALLLGFEFGLYSRVSLLLIVVDICLQLEKTIFMCTLCSFTPMLLHINGLLAVRYHDFPLFFVCSKQYSSVFSSGFLYLQLLQNCLTMLLMRCLLSFDLLRSLI